MNTTVSYTITGMTCDHCAASVTEEVSEIPGVADVRVELASGTVHIASDVPIERAAVEAAVRGAGYQLV